MRKAWFKQNGVTITWIAPSFFLLLAAVIALAVVPVFADDTCDSIYPSTDDNLFQVDSSNWQVVVHEGDVRASDRPPDTIVYANVLHESPPAGVDIREDGVLWRLDEWVSLMSGGSWIEMHSKNESDTLGIQFWGDDNDGWARVTVDGEEVWTGDTYGATATDPAGAFINYLEISNLPLAEHVVRVESTGDMGGGGSDHVTVYYFGIGKAGAAGGGPASEVDERDTATTAVAISGGVLGAIAVSSIPYSASGLSAKVMMKMRLQRRRPRGWRRFIPVPAWKRTLYGTLLGAVSSVCLAAFFQPGGVTALSWITAIWTAAAGGGITFGLGYSMGAIWTYIRPPEESVRS
jgi:hypothetical protein